MFANSKSSSTGNSYTSGQCPVPSFNNNIRWWCVNAYIYTKQCLSFIPSICFEAPSIWICLLNCLIANGLFNSFTLATMKWMAFSRDEREIIIENEKWHINALLNDVIHFILRPSFLSCILFPYKFYVNLLPMNRPKRDHLCYMNHNS